ncbi:MAG TPA: mechanosensitive ion channel family protein, partial [Acidimicrobiales bacterium]|nr:mechanosensitive ion channel family protein [Acidimicrobiales bacterium]
LSRWAREDGLEIVLLVLGSVLLTRLIRWGVGRTVSYMDRRAVSDDTDSFTMSETRKHERALAQVVGWATVVLVFLITAFLVIQRLNVPVTTLVAPATLIGAALGFGAQRLVQDLLSGFFIITERQYGFGDIIRISPPGESVGIAGAVEEVTLRATKLRAEGGELIVIPNGEIRQVTNLSKDWARVVLDIPLSVDSDVTKATEILRRIGDEIMEDETWSRLLLDPPSVMGIERFGVGFLQLRFVARTLPGRQWDVARELRGRISLAFQQEGVAVPPTVLDVARSTP